MDASLIAGIALAVKTINPNVQILGVEPERCPSMSAAMAAGHPVKVEMPGPTLADGLAAGHTSHFGPVVGPFVGPSIGPSVRFQVSLASVTHGRTNHRVCTSNHGEASASLSRESE